MGLGIHGLLAEVVVACAAGIRVGSRLQRALNAGVACAVLLLQLLVPPPVDLLMHRIFVGFEQLIGKGVASLPAGPGLEHSRIIVLNTDNYTLASFIRVYWNALTAPRPQLSHVLGASAAPVRLERPERDVIVLEPEGGFLNEPTSWLVRRPSERFQVGQSIMLLGMTVVVERVTSDGRPARVRIHVTGLDHPHWLWVAWNGEQQRFERVTLPPVGGALDLPDPSPAE